MLCYRYLSKILTKIWEIINFINICKYIIKMIIHLFNILSKPITIIIILLIIIFAKYILLNNIKITKVIIIFKIY